MLTNTKYEIYKKISSYFPKYFKKRTFASLHEALKKGATKLPSENELLILHLFLNEKFTVIDIGANNGLYCYYFQEVIKCKDIHAFEPIPSLNNRLKKWFSDIHFYPYAVSDTISTATLKIPYINDVVYETRAKLDALTEIGESGFREIEIETKTIDSIFLKSINKIDFIKIDIEGHEFKAVMGGQGLIKRDKPIMMIEIEARHHGREFKNVVAKICALGYECFYFNLKEKKLESFSNFSIEAYQDSNLSYNNYINNFLFFPINTISIEGLNEQIKQILT